MAGSPTEHKAVLFGNAAVERGDLLAANLKTAWQLLPLSQDSSLETARAAVAGATAWVSTRFSMELGEAASELRGIFVPAAGTNLIDPDAVPPQAAVCNVYEHETPIAEYVIATLLAMVTRWPYYASTFRRGEWAGHGWEGGDVFHGETAGMKLGLIGYGHIGKAVERRAKAFDMTVLPIRSRSREDELEHVIRESDALVISCPLNDRTRGLFDARRLALLKPTATLINVARAQIIDEAALFDTLSHHRIAGAVLDVWYQYPDDFTQRMHGSKLPFHELDNVILTPHFSAWTKAMVHRRWQRTAENLDHLARGEPLDRVVINPRQ